MPAFWTNEYEVPLELLSLLDNPKTPKQLWVEIAKAKDEVENRGAVTYPTKARVEYYINQNSDIIVSLLNE